jgi:hypothetical protein
MGKVPYTARMEIVVVGALVVRTIVVGAFVVVSIKYIHNFDKFDPYFCLIVNKHKRRENRRDNQECTIHRHM